MRKIFPTLYEKSTTGKIKYWSIEVVASLANGVSTIIIKYGADQEKERITKKTISKGKNIGRSNETSSFAQAVNEAESAWKRKLDKGYVEKKEDLDIKILLPMLAHKFQERKHNIKFPAYVQPKFDGVRCLARKISETKIEYFSRMGKLYTTLEHLTPDLLHIMDINEILDGEIYSHDLTFQELASRIKKQGEGTEKLEFHVFDIADTTKDFKTRLAILEAKCKKLPKNSLVKFVTTDEIKTEMEVYTKHDEFVKAGYEGVIIRNKNGLYKFKDRTKDLQKYKEFKDEEFTIVGGYEGTGTEAGCITFTCKNKSNQEFNVRPRGSFEQRKMWMQDIKNLIGKKLTVRYQELTDSGIPRFPVGICIRDYEDFNHNKYISP